MRIYFSLHLNLLESVPYHSQIHPSCLHLHWNLLGIHLAPAPSHVQCRGSCPLCLSCFPGMGMQLFIWTLSLCLSLRLLIFPLWNGTNLDVNTSLNQSLPDCLLDFCFFVYTATFPSLAPTTNLSVNAFVSPWIVKISGTMGI